MREPRDIHARLQDLVDENFGYRPTTPIEGLLTILEKELGERLRSEEEQDEEIASLKAAHSDSVVAVQKHYESENARLRSQLSALREALKALRELPDTWPACAIRDYLDVHDVENCDKCISEREYRQRCIDVMAQADAALASTEPGGEGRKP